MDPETMRTGVVDGEKIQYLPSTVVVPSRRVTSLPPTKVIQKDTR